MPMEMIIPWGIVASGLAIGLIAVIKMPRSAFGNGSQDNEELEDRVEALEIQLKGLRREIADNRDRLASAERLIGGTDSGRR